MKPEARARGFPCWPRACVPSLALWAGVEARSQACHIRRTAEFPAALSASLTTPSSTSSGIPPASHLPGTPSGPNTKPILSLAGQSFSAPISPMNRQSASGRCVCGRRRGQLAVTSPQGQAPDTPPRCSGGVARCPRLPVQMPEKSAFAARKQRATASPQVARWYAASRRAANASGCQARAFFLRRPARRRLSRRPKTAGTIPVARRNNPFPAFASAQGADLTATSLPPFLDPQRRSAS